MGKEVELNPEEEIDISPEKEIEIRDQDNFIIPSMKCVDCYPVRQYASYILRGSSLCEKHFIKRMEYNEGEE